MPPFAAAPAAPVWRSTTVLCARLGGAVAMGGDGQVSLGDSVIKASARKVHFLAGGSVLAGFAGATADAFTLLERFEKRLESHNRQLSRAAEALARDWRTDRVLRRLEAMLIVADKKETLTLSGVGDVIAPEDDIAAVGSGGGYARAAALALLRHGGKQTAAGVVGSALAIAGEICVYTNSNIVVEELKTDAPAS